MERDAEKFDVWALVELFGHQRLAGRVTEQAIGGLHFVRVDVPEVDGIAGYTRLFGQGAIYGITITTEDVAKRLAANMRSKPIQAYEVEQRAPALRAPNDYDEYDRG